jgi:hypothetical protein
LHSFFLGLLFFVPIFSVQRGGDFGKPLFGEALLFTPSLAALAHCAVLVVFYSGRAGHASNYGAGEIRHDSNWKK